MGLVKFNPLPKPANANLVDIHRAKFADFRFSIQCLSNSEVLIIQYRQHGRRIRTSTPSIPDDSARGEILSHRGRLTGENEVTTLKAQVANYHCHRTPRRLLSSRRREPSASSPTEESTLMRMSSTFLHTIAHPREMTVLDGPETTRTRRRTMLWVSTMTEYMLTGYCE